MTSPSTTSQESSPTLIQNFFENSSNFFICELIEKGVNLLSRFDRTARTLTGKIHNPMLSTAPHMTSPSTTSQESSPTLIQNFFENSSNFFICELIEKGVNLLSRFDRTGENLNRENTQSNAFK